MRRFTVGKLMAAVAILALGMGFCIVPIGKQAEFARLQRQMDDSIRSLRPSDPTGISPTEWDCALGWTVTAYCNVCFSPGHVGTPEMYRLRDDLARKLDRRIGVDTLAWIWDRLAQTGPHGKQYVERNLPQFEEC